jgi:hypothetical protein
MIQYVARVIIWYLFDLASHQPSSRRNKQNVVIKGMYRQIPQTPKVIPSTFMQAPKPKLRPEKAK